MAIIRFFIIAASASVVLCQRPFFAGSRPIGYPELETTTSASDLGNRFGEGTTQRLPLEALGDKDLVDRLSKLPVDKQPFWFINWQVIEANRQKPQTYPLRPNPFAETPQATTGVDNTSVNTNLGSTNVSSVPNADLDNRSGDTSNNGNTTDSGTTLPPSTNASVTIPIYNSTAKQSVYSSSKQTETGKVLQLY